MTASQDRATSLPVYVLIGGRSQRFGADKASHEVDGEPWALHVGRRLAENDRLITLVGREPPGDELAGLAFARDAEAIDGPLAGVISALRDRRERFGAGLLVLASCDLVRPQRSWLDRLVRRFDSSPQLSAAAYRSEDRWQPFPSMLHTRWLDGLVEDREAVSLQAAFDATGAAAVPWPGDPAGPPQANDVPTLTRLLSERP